MNIEYFVALSIQYNFVLHITLYLSNNFQNKKVRKKY